VKEPGVTAVDWNAAAYHRVSQPQLDWGMKVLPRLCLTGAETVVDTGCGSGRLTAELLRHLPRGRVIAVDQSAAMLEEAERHTRDEFGDRVAFLRADIQDLRLPEPVDVIFSTATFHWVPDHPRLFRALFRGLRPGGRLVAQCGGGPNIDQVRRRAAALLDSSPFRDAARGWRDPWHFAYPEEAARDLAAAGFVEIETGLEHAPVVFPDLPAYREFVASAVLPAHLAAVPDDETRERFVMQLAMRAAADDPPFSLDYWRLNLSARRLFDS
jgi:trans-aconitate 2-methyltransferase